MGKPDGQSRRSGQEESAIDGKFFGEGQVLELGEDKNDHAGNADDIEGEGLDVAKWDKRNRLWFVPEAHRLEGLRQHHDSEVAGH